MSWASNLATEGFDRGSLTLEGSKLTYAEETPEEDRSNKGNYTCAGISFTETKLVRSR